MHIETFVHLILGLFFVFHGVNHFIHLKELTKQTIHHKWTFETSNMIMISGMVLIFGGLSIMTGYYIHAGIIGILGFLLFVTPIVHTFWRGNASERGQELAHFTKNIALMAELVRMFFTGH